MGFRDAMYNLIDNIEHENNVRKGVQPRDVTVEDRASFFDAAANAKPPKNIEEMRQRIANKNPVRWSRLQREMKWAGKEAIKMGMSPEDVRWIL